MRRNRFGRRRRSFRTGNALPTKRGMGSAECGILTRRREGAARCGERALPRKSGRRAGLEDAKKAVNPLSSGFVRFADGGEIARPHPVPMASQARHQSVSPKETSASRSVVPQERGTTSAWSVRICVVSSGLRISTINCLAVAEPPQPGMAGGQGVSEPVVGAVDCPNDGRSAFCGHVSAPVLQVRLLYGVNDVAEAQRRPVKSVRTVQNDFVRAGCASGAVRTASQDGHDGFPRHPVWVGNNHHWMRSRKPWRRVTENVPSFHSKSSGR
jgi:hypothetical protein